MGGSTGSLSPSALSSRQARAAVPWRVRKLSSGSCAGGSAPPLRTVIQS